MKLGQMLNNRNQLMVKFSAETLETWPLRNETELQICHKRWASLCRKTAVLFNIIQLKIKPWRILKPVVADSHHFDEEQDPDPH